MASIGWIDFSPAHRERVGTILELLKPEGMVDELGIGTIRDALADQLFPGISTIQTRAKYFFIIPYILYEYQQMKPAERRGRTATQYLEQREYEIMWQLGDKYEPLEKETKINYGVIGITRRKPKKIIRRPSAIYWNGLRKYDFINTRGLGVNQFLSSRTKVSFESQLSALSAGDDSPGDDADADHENLFSLKIPYTPAWSQDLAMDLSPEEADIFNHRILDKGQGLLVGELMENEDLYTYFHDYSSFADFARKAILLPIPDQLRDLIILAHDFSELLYGAHIAYNQLLQHMKRPDELFSEEWAAWINNIHANMLNYEGFDPDFLFNRYAGKTRHFTKAFILDWWQLIKDGGADLERRNNLIIKQEQLNKQSKARLIWKKLDDVSEGRWVGLQQLDYRYRNAKRILTDIKSALKEEYATS